MEHIPLGHKTATSGVSSNVIIIFPSSLSHSCDLKSSSGTIKDTHAVLYYRGGETRATSLFFIIIIIITVKAQRECNSLQFNFDAIIWNYAWRAGWSWGWWEAKKKLSRVFSLSSHLFFFCIHQNKKYDEEHRSHIKIFWASSSASWWWLMDAWLQR